jgi:hypothetical protein
MGQSFRIFLPNSLICGLMTLLLCSMGCGAVGPPIPPEDVGIEAKIRKQNRDQIRKEGSTVEGEMTSPVEEEVELPTFYPIGTR